MPFLLACSFLSDADWRAANDRDGDGALTHVNGGEDCDDDDAGVYPGADDIPGDGVDQDCDGADAILATEDTGTEDTAAQPVDEDGDGFAVGDDCFDADAATHPGAPESCDGYDNDCDGYVDGECVEAVMPEPREREVLYLPDGANVPLAGNWEICGEFTLEMWVNTDFSTCYGDLAQTDDWYLRVCDSTRKLVWLVGEESSVDATVELGGWHFFAAQVGADRAMSLWLDGVSIASGSTFTGCVSPDTLYLGGGGTVGSNFQPGYYGFVRLSSVARYTGSVTGVPGELRVDAYTVGAWTMEGDVASEGGVFTTSAH